MSYSRMHVLMQIDEMNTKGQSRQVRCIPDDGTSGNPSIAVTMPAIPPMNMAVKTGLYGDVSYEKTKEGDKAEGRVFRAGFSPKNYA